MKDRLELGIPGTLGLVGLNLGCCPKGMDLVQKGEASESFHCSVCVAICVSQTSLLDLVDLLSEERSCSTQPAATADSAGLAPGLCRQLGFPWAL